MSKLLSFLGGAAKGFIEEVDKSEKYGRETALAQMKQLAENYEKTREENSKLTNELKGVEQWTKTVYGNDATPEQIAFLQGNPVAFEALKKLDNPTKFRLNDIISIVSGNESKAVGAQRVAELPELTDKVSKAIKSKGFFAREFEAAETRAASTAERQFERTFGTSAETMRAALPMQRPSVEGTFDMAKVLEKPDDFKGVMDKAKVAVFNAEREGDPAKIEYTKKVLDSVQRIEQGITDPQKQFNNDVAKAKSVLTNPASTPAQLKAANDFYDRLLKLDQREALAKKTDSKSGDIPKLATLNTHAAGNVALALGTQFGKQVSEGKITFSVDPQTRESTANILITDPDERLRVAKAAEDAARNALSNYMDPRTGEPLTIDVSSALNRYVNATRIAQAEVNKTKPSGVPENVAPPPPAGTATPSRQTQPVTPAAQPTSVPPNVDIKKERAMADAAIKAQPQNAEAIKANYKLRTGQDYK
jgi:hypothetical protein